MKTLRAKFREHPLEDAMLYFHPATGTHVRVMTESTRGLRRRAPRVAMFGVTNACNLSCEFCSRDRDASNQWTVQSAADALRGLAAAGTLEVAFGGGEPFAFPGFAELLAELHATTPLALHATTNGTLVNRRSWSSYRGVLGQVRVSIYEDNWSACASTLSEAGQRWGANVLVDGARLSTLPEMLRELSDRGCHDVSILNYIGEDERLHLDEQQRVELAKILRDSPLQCRVSVCFGDRLDVPRGMAGSDCGAGLDFVSITSDRRVKSCSFQDRSLPGADAEEILRAWRESQPLLGEPSLRKGCSRGLNIARDQVPPVAIWQAFSGNNSGECFMVAKFESNAAAEAYLAELIPSFDPNEECWPASWVELFRRERVMTPEVPDFISGAMPSEMAAVGRSVLVLGYEASDPFAPLRGLAWKRGAYVVPGGVHVHDGLTLLLAVQANDGADAQTLLESSVWPAQRHGERVVMAVPMQGERDVSWVETKKLIDPILGARPYSSEIHEETVSDGELVRVVQQLGSPRVSRPRLLVSFWGERGEEKTRAFVGMLDVEHHVAGLTVLIEGVARRNRLAVLGFRHGGAVNALEGEWVEVDAWLWFDPVPSRGKKGTPRMGIDTAPLEMALQTSTLQAEYVEVTAPASPSWPTTAAKIRTQFPGLAMSALAGHAAAVGCKLSVGVCDVDPLRFAVRRLLDELEGS